MRFLAIPIVLVVLVAGVWLTGGVLTNDFALAMWLTVAWMVLAGLGCLAVAARSASLRWPVLGTYAVTAAVLTAYLGSSALFDKEVDEQVATAVEPAAMAASRSGPARAGLPMNVLLGRGSFVPVAHAATGEARLIDLADGGTVVTLTDFEVDNGPDLRVYLVAGPAETEGDVEDFVDLGGLKGNRGDQQYAVPDDVDVGRYSTVVIWCRAFSVLFARAPTRA